MSEAVEAFHAWWRSTVYTSPRLKKVALEAWLEAWITKPTKNPTPPTDKGEK